MRPGGDPQQAIHWAEDGATVCREAGNRQGEAAALRWLGAALDALGHRGDARSSWQGASALYTALGMSEADYIRVLLTGGARQPDLQV